MVYTTSGSQCLVEKDFVAQVTYRYDVLVCKCYIKQLQTILSCGAAHLTLGGAILIYSHSDHFCVTPPLLQNQEQL